jgi:chaperone required for assembly of F1-ATPase
MFARAHVAARDGAICVTQTFESLKPPKRFYLGVDVAATDDGFAVRLDGRNARTPAGRALAVPTAALARLVADEWQTQADVIAMATMPATRLAHTAIDNVAGQEAAFAALVAECAAHDSICYLADGPQALVERQQAAWRPLLGWARQELALDFETTAGVVHRDQPAATLAAVKTMALARGAFALAGIVLAAQTFGSAILALALMHGRVDGPQAAAAALLDELFQAEQWGEDDEAEARRRAIEAEAAMLQHWFAALR